MFDALDNGPALDKVLTDKAVVLSFVAYAGGLAGKPPSGVDAMPDAGFAEFVYSLLAHVFRKFPALWTMNWMFFRPRSGPLRGVRVHRLAGAVDLRRRPEYFASRAFLDDFVRKYYRRPLGAV